MRGLGAGGAPGARRPRLGGSGPWRCPAQPYNIT